MANLLYVVHRYAPYPGGSEYNVQRFAEASVSLGHSVTVLAGTHGGNLNGVRVTSDINILHQDFDLIIIHGWTGGMQHAAFTQILTTPILYLLIKPDDRPEVVSAMNSAKFIGCATSNDVQFVAEHGFFSKIIMVDYPIEHIEIRTTKDELRKQFGITRPIVYISVGGFSPHKGMDDLIETFEMCNNNDIELILTGYDTGHGIPSTSDDRISLYNLNDRESVYELMSIADLLIWNSKMHSEGYGLVLLEAMINNCRWIGTDDAGARDLSKCGFGRVYKTNTELLQLLKQTEMLYSNDDSKNIASDHVKKNHDPKYVTRKMLERANIQ